MADKDEASMNEVVEDEVVSEEVAPEVATSDDAVREEATEAEDTVETDGSDDDAATDETVEGDAQKSEHDEYVEKLAAGFAALVAKGEEVVAALGAQAEAAGKAFEERAADADAEWSSFADDMQARMKAAAAQFAKDLEVFSNAVDKKEEGAVSEAPDAVEAPDATEAPDAAGVSATDTDATDASPYTPQFTPATLAMRERMRVGAHSELMLTDPEFVERFANFAFDDVVSDVDLPDRTRFMCWLATLLGCQGIDEFRALLPAALNVGVEPVAVKEIVYQATAYLGIGRVYPFLKATNEAMMAAGVQLPLKAQASTLPTEESRYEGGEKAQVACFGEQMYGYKDRGAADYPHIAQWLVKNCFGDWYARGGLTIAEREMVTFCYIAAQGGCEPQLRAHTAANVQCGNDRDFLIKVVSNNVPFIGYPRSLNAMAVVEEITGAKE